MAVVIDDVIVDLSWPDDITVVAAGVGVILIKGCIVWGKFSSHRLSSEPSWQSSTESHLHCAGIQAPEVHRNPCEAQDWFWSVVVDSVDVEGTTG